MEPMTIGKWALVLALSVGAGASGYRHWARRGPEDSRHAVFFGIAGGLFCLILLGVALSLCAH